MDANRFKENVLSENSLSEDLAQLGLYNRDNVNTYWEELAPVMVINAYLTSPQEENSFFGFIMNNSDFVDPAAEEGKYPDEKVIPIKLPETEQELQQYNYWNPSINNLFQSFDDNLNSNEEFGNIDTKLLFESIENTDAAVGFGFPKYMSTTYVNPNRNLNNEAYEDNRGERIVSYNFALGDDQTEHGLGTNWQSNINNTNDDTRADNLQFTSMQNNQGQQHENIEELHKWLRLIMPKYSRHVEVEDLDRNFWVIGNILDKLLDYLFGTKNPYIDPLQKILNELAQLWENTLHLWLNLALINQKEKYNDIHLEFIPLPADKMRQYIKYDNFDYFNDSSEKGLYDLIQYIYQGPQNSSFAARKEYYDRIFQLLETGESEEEIQQNLKVNPNSAHYYIIRRLKYLEEKYSNQRLCIIPYIRLNNYNNNYFSTIFLPGVYWYDFTQEEKWSVTTLKYSNDPWEDMTDAPPGTFTVSKPIIIDMLQRYGSRPYTSYLYGIKELTGDQCYIGSPLDSFDVLEKKIYYALLRFVPEINFSEEGVITNFTLSLQDAGKYAATKEIKEIGKFIFSNKIESNMNTAIGKYEDGDGAEPEYKNAVKIFQQAGFYQGELLSIPLEIEPPVEQIVDMKILKIGDFLPMEYTLGNDILIPYKGAIKVTNKQDEFADCITIKNTLGLTNIYAVKSGIVHLGSGKPIGFSQNLGTYVYIQSNETDINGNTLYYFYGNLIRTVNLREGQSVSKDQLIGYSNSCYFGVAIYNEVFKSQNITTYTKIPNAYGVYAKDDDSFEPNNYEDNETSIAQSFDTLTYGLGSYRYNTQSGVTNYRRNYLNTILSGNVIHGDSEAIYGHQDIDGRIYITEGALKFIRYRLKEQTDENDQIYYDSKKTDFSSFHIEEVKMSNLEEWGKEYAMQQIILNNKENQDQFFLTKIGINYWTGSYNSAAAPQWNYGITCHLLAYDANTKTITSLGEVPIFDGFWTENTTVFTLSNDTQWRRLGIQAKIKKITRKHGSTVKVIYNFSDGWLIWYDHNQGDSITGADTAKVKIPIKLVEEQDGDTIKKHFVRDYSRTPWMHPMIQIDNSRDWTGATTIDEWYNAAIRTVDTSNNSPFIVYEHATRLTDNRYIDEFTNERFAKGIIRLEEIPGNITDPIEKLRSGSPPECYLYMYEENEPGSYWANHSKWNIDT